MMPAIDVSPRTEAWLERKAGPSGDHKASVAARVLDHVAEKELPPLTRFPGEGLWRFRAWVATVPARPGSPVDGRRGTIYD